jgi:hypothetical protein
MPVDLGDELGVTGPVCPWHRHPPPAARLRAALLTGYR